MPLAGGAAAKFGIRYEDLWTVSRLLDVMDEKADSIRLEPPGSEGQGVEFWMERQGVREYHQVKRQHDNGHWTLPTLKSEGVLGNFFEILKDPSACCVFVSANSAQQLAELSERARSAASWEEFEAEFLKSGQVKKNFDRVRGSFSSMSDQETYERLKRVHIRTIDENFLRTTTESRASVLVEGEAANVVDVLAAMALDNVHSELIALDIWNHLESREFYRRRWDKDPRVLAAVERASKRYLDPLRLQAIDGAVLPRQEVQQVRELLDEANGKTGVLVTGEAGVGKSGVMLQVVEKLLKERTAVVAFRADRLEPTQLPDKVGEQIGLPGSPANVLAAVSKGRRCVLVIDQLDALSLASGRNTDFFDCIYEIMEQARAHPKMRILLACRKFDLDNDHRLRQLTDSEGVAEAVTVERLAHETVRKVVAGFGLDAGSLNAQQLDLLSIPLHLKLLSELVADEEIRALNFERAQDLYARFWKRKQDVIRERLGQPVQWWTQVVYALCDHMHERQALSAPETVVDEWDRDVKALVSDNVLVLDNKRYSFFHEGFFDYAFARRFAGGGQCLLGLLESDEQHLFRRAQVRQILLYLRDAKFDRYIADLKKILSSPDVRFHVKQVIFALLADLSEPTKAEWEVVCHFAGRDFSDPATRHAWATVRRPAWFRLVDCLGLVRKWLDDPDEDFVDRTVSILNVVQRELPDRVAELVEQYVGESEIWNNRLRHLALRGDWSLGRRFLELMLQLIDKGVLDDVDGALASNSDSWLHLTRFRSNRPSWGCEVVAHYLNRNAGQSNPFGFRDGAIAASPFGERTPKELAAASVRRRKEMIVSPFGERTLKELADGAPESFVQEILPFMRSVIADCASQESGGLRKDPVWSFRFYQGGSTNNAALLNAMETALSKLAVQNPDLYCSETEPFRDSPYETLQYLLIRSLAANGPLFADLGVDHLCERPECLEIGYTSDQHWASRQLIEAISPHCSDEKLRQLETLLLGFYSDWEKSNPSGNRFGRAQYKLLGGIEETRRSEEATKRLAELRRKFGQREPSPPEPTGFQEVQSPIHADAAEKMSDAQWLSAVRKYDVDRDAFTQDGGYVGGARELSRVLESMVKRDPERFAKLALKFPDDTNSDYFEALLRGIGDTRLDMDTIVGVCERCHRIEGRPLGRHICDPIASLAQGSLPPAAFDLVAWYATEDPDPKQEPWRTPASPGGDPYYGGDILTNGINTSRGRAARAMAKLIDADRGRLAHFRPALEKMVRDPSLAVRSCVAQTLLAVMRHDRHLAVELFQQLCKSEDALLQTHFMERFLAFALQTHFQELSPIVERMVSSQLPDVATAGARQACLAALHAPEAASLAEICLSGSEAQRIGAAQVVAAKVRMATCRAFCEDALIRLFNDSNDEVRNKAARCFVNFKGTDFAEYVCLVTQFVNSSAFQQNWEDFFMALEWATGKLPEVALSACERFVEIAGPYTSNTSTGASWTASTVTKLTLRIYQQSTEEDIRARSLVLVDRLMEHSAYGIDEGLQDFER